MICTYIFKNIHLMIILKNVHLNFQEVDIKQFFSRAKQSNFFLLFIVVLLLLLLVCFYTHKTKKKCDKK